jgi:hypothetical protein
LERVDDRRDLLSEHNLNSCMECVIGAGARNVFKPLPWEDENVHCGCVILEGKRCALKFY